MILDTHLFFYLEMIDESHPTSGLPDRPIRKGMYHFEIFQTALPQKIRSCKLSKHISVSYNVMKKFFGIIFIGGS